MIVYRVQVQDAQDWASEYVATLAEAQRLAARLDGRVYVDRLEIPPGREGVVMALNMAGANRTVWEGEEIWKKS